jgi:hypothetical protein
MKVERISNLPRILREEEEEKNLNSRLPSPRLSSAVLHHYKPLASLQTPLLQVERCWGTH